MGQLVPSDVAKQMLPGLRTEFMKQYKGVPVNYDRVTLIVPSKHLSEDYGWLGQLPSLREFGAERIPKGLSEYKYTIKNKKWEASVRVDNDIFRFEQYGQAKALVGGFVLVHVGTTVGDPLDEPGGGHDAYKTERLDRV